MSQPTPPQSAANNLPESKPGSGKGCGCQGGCLVTLAVLAVLLGILMAAVPIGAKYIARRGQSAAQLKELEDIQTVPINFPREWANVPPYSKELIDQLERVRIASTALPTTVTANLQDTSMSLALVEILHGQPLTHPEMWTSITLVATSAHAFLSEFNKLTQISDYETDALKDPDPLFSYLSSVTQIYPQHRWLAAAASLTHARAGKCQEALEFALLPLRLAKRHPASAGHSEAEMLVYNGSHQAVNVAKECRTTETLKSLLAGMNELAPSVTPATAFPPRLLGVLGELRRYKRDGYPSDLEPGKSQFHYTFVSLEARFGLYPKFMVETLPLGDKRRPVFQRQVEELKSIMGGPVRVTPLAALRGARMIAPDFLARMSNMDIYGQTTISPALYFDLARLRIARELASLEGEQVTTASVSLVPKYLPADPVDPYSKAPYLWDPKTEQHYSVGPDGFDQRLSSEVDYARRYVGGSTGGDIAVPAHPARPALTWY